MPEQQQEQFGKAARGRGGNFDIRGGRGSRGRVSMGIVVVGPPEPLSQWWEAVATLHSELDPLPHARSRPPRANAASGHRPAQADMADHTPPHRELQLPP